MRKVINFNAGPGMLPEEVLLRAQHEMLDWNGTGMSIMELGHRGEEFQSVAKKAEDDLRELMHIPDFYRIFFLPGGATAQFAMVPINLMGASRVADYVETGVWSRKAVLEAKRYGEVNVASAPILKDGLNWLPPVSEWSLNSKSSYVHYTPNETVDGIEYQWVPDVGDVPLVADMSSMILSRPIDVTRYGLIYAGAQKNMGQAGITVVIVRDDLIKSPLPNMPTLYSYQVHADNHSFYNTPPTYSWYIAGLMLEWLIKQGGVEKQYELNKRKSVKCYQAIDDMADFYHNKIHPESRSMVNVTFSLPSETLTDTFLQEATDSGLCNLRGHKLAGGVRASIYNAMPEEGVDALVTFMKYFYQLHA